jgi:predicted P-loop ATPase
MEKENLYTESLKQETEKDPYLKKADALVREWAAEMDKLKAKADQAEADAQIEYRNQIDDLRRRKERVQNKLDEIRSSSDAAFTELKSGLEQAVSDFRSGIERAVSKFK